MSVDSVQAAIAANRDVPKVPPSACQDCATEIRIELFFDGTGNNRQADESENKWSNVSRLFDSAFRAAQLYKDANIHPIYIRGVGTSTNSNAVHWLEKAGIWVEDNLLGGGTGAGGERRLEEADFRVNERLRNTLVENAKTLGGHLEKYAKENAHQSFDAIDQVVGKYRLIKVIDISIFGFSRGAALARAFSNRIIKECNGEGVARSYQGYPLRIGFLGLFDTVASFGVPAQNIRTPFTERELTVPSTVERCVHFIAAHELRFSFPVDLIRKKGVLPEGWSERVFPGVHSDVGGGYSPNEQGIDHNYARIPLREMMGEAVMSGVRLLSYEQLKQNYNQIFRERFECRAETDEAYIRYMKACSAANGTIENQIKEHMKLYYSANGTMYRRGIQTVTDHRRRENKVKAILGPQAMATEVANYRTLQKDIGRIRFGGSSASSFAQYVKIQDWQLAAWDTTAQDCVIDFFRRHVHDSKVDFLLNVEPFSYFCSRGIEESSSSIWTKGGNWIRGKTRALNKAASAAKHAVEEKIHNATEAVSGVAAKETSEVIERLYESGANWVRTKFLR